LIWLNCKSDLDCPGSGGILIALEMSNCDDGSAFWPSGGLKKKFLRLSVFGQKCPKLQNVEKMLTLPTFSWQPPNKGCDAT
jgi:hypothetical protein